MDNIEVYPIPALSDNYIWAIKRNHKAIIVDPGEAAPVQEFLQKNQLYLHGILLTHHHQDHTGGVKELIANTNVPIWGIDFPHKNRTPIDNKTLEIKELSLKFEVIDIPGHTLDHIAFYGHGMVFCGDTLFACGMGRIFEGTAPQMYKSVMSLAKLPPETKVYCAHEYTLSNIKFALHVEPSNSKLIARRIQSEKLRSSVTPTLPTTIKEELETNPFLRAHSPEIQDSVSKHLKRTVSAPLEIFTSLRTWKDSFNF